MRARHYPVADRDVVSGCGSLAAHQLVEPVDAAGRSAHARRAMSKTEDEHRIVVRSFPSTDRDFADAMGDALDGALATSSAPATLAEVVQQRLRGGYPNARIQVQDELGHLGMQETVWYAYRDGRIRESDPIRERLYSVVAAARRTVRESEIVMDHSRKVSRAAGYDDDAGPATSPPSDEVRLPPRKRR